MRWAVPSFVIPDTVAGNVRFLRGRVPEVALCFFETGGCLAYTDADLPAIGETADLRFHVHLPTDLAWESGEDPGQAAAAAFRNAFSVFSLAAYLKPRLAILHPPAADGVRASDLLAAFLENWQSVSDVPLCLENTPESPLTDLDQKLFGPGGYRLCLDAGHLMGYHQEKLLDLPILQSTSIIHWSAPCGGDRHHPLTELTQTERETAREILRRTIRRVHTAYRGLQLAGHRSLPPRTQGALGRRSRNGGLTDSPPPGLSSARGRRGNNGGEQKRTVTGAHQELA